MKGKGGFVERLAKAIRQVQQTHGSEFHNPFSSCDAERLADEIDKAFIGQVMDRAPEGGE